MTKQTSIPVFLTPAECQEVAQTMTTKYAHSLGARYFEVEARTNQTGVFIRLVLRDKSTSFFYPVEGRIALGDHELSARDAALIVLDYMDVYFAEYFSSGGEVYLPIDWADYEVDGLHLQLRGQIINLEQEQQADAILKQAGFSLNDELNHLN